jgi:hypothetical protein
MQNPYWKTFDPFVIPLLEQPMDLRRFEELDTNLASVGSHLHEASRVDPSVGQMYDGAA